jgi:hypothetical protein
MKNVRIKKAPGTRGEQDQFALVDNLTPYYGHLGADSDTVSESMTALKGEDLRKAKIEVEGGESVIGDSNRDGHIDLFHFKGKRHSEGGMPVDIPEGSFIYSDTKNLKIKDKEILQKFFGLPFKKGGYTPAEISKKFSINKYVQILKDEDADQITKRTANEMIKRHTEKLGVLAFVQEAMKGFPDGIPEIAMTALATLGHDIEELMAASAPPEMMMPGAPAVSPDEVPMDMGMQEEMMMAPEEPMMRYGGQLSQYDNGGSVNDKGQAWQNASDQQKRIAKRLAQAGYHDVTPLPNGKITFRNYSGDRGFNTVNVTNSQYLEHLYKTPPPPPPVTTTKLKSGSVYTYADRPNATYKVENGKVFIKSPDTNEKYVQITDPARVKALEAGIDSGKTKLNAKPSTKESIPGFGDRATFNKFKNSGEYQREAAQLYEEALASGDPDKMLRYGKVLKEFDIEYSVGWLPWTDQDKLEDMSGILEEQAQSLMNRDFEKKRKELQSKSDSYIEKIIKKNRETMNSLPVGSSERSSLLEENKKLSDLTSKERGPWSFKPADITFITSAYDDKFGTSLSSDYNVSYFNPDLDISERARLYSERKGLAESTSQDGRKGVFTIKGDDALAKEKSKFEYIVETGHDGKPYYQYTDTKSGNLQSGRVTDLRTIERLNKQLGQSVELPSATSASTSAGATTPAPATSSTTQSGTGSTAPRAGTTSSAQGTRQLSQSERVARSSQADDLLMSFKQGGTYRSPYQFKYGGQTQNLKKYEVAGVVTGGPDEEFVKDGVVDGVSVKLYKRKDGSNVMRNAETGELLVVYDAAKNKKTIYDPEGGYYYNMQVKNGNWIETPKSRKPYAGEAWKKEGWQGKYDESSKEFERLLRGNPDIQQAVIAEFKRGIQSDDYYGSKLRAQRPQDYAKYKEYLLSLSDDQIINTLIKGNTDNLRLKSIFEGREGALREADWDVSASGQRNEFYRDLTQQLGISPFEDESQIAAYEGAYQAAARAFSRSPEIAEKAREAGFTLTPTGVADQVDAKGRPITPITGIAGNTFIQETFELGEKPPGTPPPPEVPGQETKYYCVESGDGKSVVAVSHKQGEQPVAPAGAVSGAYSDKASADAVCAASPELQAPPAIAADGPWYLPDYTNFLTASRQRIGDFPPSMRLARPMGIGYDTINPITRIASVLSGKRQRDELASQMLDPTTAMSLAYSDGQVSQDLAQQIGDVEVQNVGISNQAYAQNAQIQNQMEMFNVGQREKYDIGVATYGQQRINALNKKDALRTAMYNTGWKNWTDKKTREQVLYPQARQNPILGDWAFSGRGRDITNPFETYVNPMTGGSGSAGNYEAYRKQAAMEADNAYNDNLKYSEEEARKAATQAYNRRMAMLTSGRTGSGSRAQQAALDAQGVQFGAVAPPTYGV